MNYDFSIPVDIVRTDRRKSAEIQLTHDAIKVRVPNTLTDKAIESLINRRSEWIRNKLKEQSRHRKPIAKEFVSGEAFPYLGRNYRLKVSRGEQAEVKLICGYFRVIIPKDIENQPEVIRQLLIDWFKCHALERFRVKVERFSKMVGVTPNSVSIKDYKARWGSCSTSGDITFNWRIIHAPHSVVDYIVVHELCHMIEHNHSDKFWRIVQSIVPKWKENRAWLKEHGVALNMIYYRNYE